VDEATRRALENVRALELKPCPRCGAANWIAEQQSLLVSGPAARFVIPPPHVPALLLTCTKCGFLSYHSVKVLNGGELDGGGEEE
jgi:ribosomal protein S27AE